ncbi:MAG TPA: glycosyltransferase, partial [Arcobacter sp.]|nr:glycosyltransferase [Arcobacter sp.]
MSFLKQANDEFKNKEYKKSLDLYQKAINQAPELTSLIMLNMELAYKRLSSSDNLKSKSIRKELKVSDKEKYEVIKRSKLFDEKYYLQMNLDVAKKGINTLKHYITYGENENRQPNDSFNPRYYQQKYKDIRDSGISPFYHFVKYGLKEGRSTVGKANNILPNEEKFQIIQHTMKQYQKSLLNWEIEKRKVRNLNLVSVIIPVYGQRKLTNEALKSLSTIDAGVEFEVIIINNGQNEEDRKSWDEWSHISKFKIVHNERNLNFALCCNLGFSLSLGSIVVFLNNDTTVTEGWLKNLITPLDNENVSSTQPRLLYPDGNLQCVGIVFS